MTQQSNIKYPILGYAPGNYMSTCKICQTGYMGDKYSVHCEPCAINTLNESHSIALTRIKELEKVISKLKDIKEFLNNNEI